MATALDSYAPFDAGPGANVTEDMWRSFMRNNQGGSGVMRGILNSFEVYADSTGMQVKVKTGECWIQGHWGSSTSEKILPIAGSHATLARKDRVVLRCDFTTLNRIELDVKTGTAAASPTALGPTQTSSIWETSLAVVNVAAAASTIAAGNVVPDVNYTGAFAKYRRATATTQAIANNTVIKTEYPTALQTCADVVASGTNNTDFTLMRAGEWTITATTFLNTANQTGFRSTFIAPSSTSATRYGVVSGWPDSNGNVVMQATVTDRFAANSALSVYSYQSSGSAGIVNSDDNLSPTLVTFRWNGW